MRRLLILLLAAPALADDVQVTHVRDFDSERAPVHTVVPAYPEKARRDRIEGDVQVCFDITPEGKPYRIAVRKSSNRLFERPAIKAVRASSYERLEAGQQDSGIKTCRTFRFRLDPIVSSHSVIERIAS